MVESTPGSGHESSADQPLPSSPTAFHHQPVMVDEVVALVTPLQAGTFLDATVGGGGHAEAILDAHPGLKLVGIDQDPTALAATAQRLAAFGPRLRLERARFDELQAALDRGAAEGEEDPSLLSGFLFDLGVSSPQLDRAERGFSFRNDGPLDMRMNPDAALSAATVVNEYEHGDLSRLIRTYSDERFASRIAGAIVAARPIQTTAQLAEIVVNAIPAPARRRGGHPAKRTFQAIRIEVNDELRVLLSALEAALDGLKPGGRGLVMTYHSGEDRIVKNSFRERTAVERPPGLPVEGPGADFAIVRPAVRRSSDAELAANPRARSARLRTIERVAA